ncbi:flagellar hook-associated 2-like protein [Novosphingobium umbonatum]|uniref:Flagellar hook-associated protein 2 n=1 Tax=Novosphingobium umbonatum TaxID=1908524 RepID=A0A437ND15_9SPHN|nr:flagellar filament capping protein FliD [Novosphingobium umbonatum]RVU07841.1 flagellar hook-associated 2-like protein [Novosphingobium umbonatum]
MATTTSSTSTTTTTTSDAATIGSALLTALGGGTGIDMTALAGTISEAQYMSQTNALTTRIDKLSTQISEASQLKSDLLTLSSSLNTLIQSGGLLPEPTVTNSSVASASLPSGSAGSTSGYTLEVTQLAASQVLATTLPSASGVTPATGVALTSSSTLKGGTLTFDFGTITGSSFAADASHSSTTITITDGQTLADLASAINSADIGITAYIATNANGSQLVMKGAEGAANAFTITTSDDASATGDNSLSIFSYNPASTSTTMSGVLAATDAVYKLDGISRTSTSNTIDNAAPGLSLKLTGTNSGNATTITFSDPSSTIKTTMTNLVSALNTLVTEINTDTSASTGNLYNDSGAKAAKRAFSTLVNTVIMPNAASGEPSTLADLGVTMAKDGSFTLDSSMLSSALTSNVNGVAAMFTDGIYGIYATMFNTISALTTAADPGSLAGSITAYNDLTTTLTAKKTEIATQQETLRQRLITQYSAANSTVATYNSTLTYMKNQIAAWNNTSG